MKSTTDFDGFLKKIMEDPSEEAAEMREILERMIKAEISALKKESTSQ